MVLENHGDVSPALNKQRQKESAENNSMLSKTQTTGQLFVEFCHFNCVYSIRRLYSALKYFTELTLSLTPVSLGSMGARPSGAFQSLPSIAR